MITTFHVNLLKSIEILLEVFQIDRFISIFTQSISNIPHKFPHQRTFLDHFLKHRFDLLFLSHLLVNDFKLVIIFLIFFVWTEFFFFLLLKELAGELSSFEIVFNGCYECGQSVLFTAHAQENIFQELLSTVCLDSFAILNFSSVINLRLSFDSLGDTSICVNFCFFHCSILSYYTSCYSFFSIFSYSSLFNYFLSKFVDLFGDYHFVSKLVDLFLFLDNISVIIFVDFLFNLSAISGSVYNFFLNNIISLFIFHNLPNHSLLVTIGICYYLFLYLVPILVFRDYFFSGNLFARFWIYVGFFYYIVAIFVLTCDFLDLMLLAIFIDNRFFDYFFAILV